MNNLNFILGQIFGAIALIILVISLQKNDRKELIKLQVLSCFGYFLQYCFLSAWTGALMNLICGIRNIVYYKKNKKVSKFVIALFCIMMIVVSIFSYNGPISLLPMIATALYTIFLGIGNITTIRIVETISCTLFLIYNVKVKAITGLIATIVELIAVIIALINERKQKNSKNTCNYTK